MFKIDCILFNEPICNWSVCFVIAWPSFDHWKNKGWEPWYAAQSAVNNAPSGNTSDFEFLFNLGESELVKVNQKLFKLITIHTLC